MLTIKSLVAVNYDLIYKAFGEAFKDYEVQITRQEFDNMLLRKGYDAELSFAAFDEKKIVAFSLTGTSIFEGDIAAYDIATGTLEEYRGQGLANKIFSFAAPLIKKAGMSQYVLEVLQHNEKALSIYKKFGFEISRELNYFVSDCKDIKLLERDLNPRFYFKWFDIDDYLYLPLYMDFYPSWQNSLNSIARNKRSFKSVAVFDTDSFVDSDRVIAFGVIEPATGDIAQIAVAPDYRRLGIGTALLSNLISLNKYSSLKFINTDVNCVSISKFLSANSFIVSGKQYEMIKTF